MLSKALGQALRRRQPGTVLSSSLHHRNARSFARKASSKLKDFTSMYLYMPAGFMHVPAAGRCMTLALCTAA